MRAAFRRATPEDEPILAAIERDCFAHPHWTAADFSKYETTVAEVEGKVVGFAVRYPVYEEADGQIGESEFEVLNVAVLPTYRRLGIARALLLKLTQTPGSYFLEVRESNDGARSLYRSLGFSEVGRRPHYYQFPDETAIVMRVKRC